VMTNRLTERLDLLAERSVFFFTNLGHWQL
jgi:hypothetical protein